jgi:hypothetical protein
MLWDTFTERFGKDDKSGLKFDPVLQYVSFPYVEVQRKGRRADREREIERQLGYLGRKDMTYFLGWLYENGVRHIIRLTVEDSGEKIHSDKAIQESVQRFIVEELDWQKTDLDPETILHVSSKAIEGAYPTTENLEPIELVPGQQLKKLHLRWSGSNAVLRAWGEPEGLSMLPQLQQIYIYKPPLEKVRVSIFSTCL